MNRYPWPMTNWSRMASAALVFVTCFGSHAQRVALTFDDLPRYGAMPAGQTRVEIAKLLVKALKEGGVPRPQGSSTLGSWRAIPG